MSTPTYINNNIDQLKQSENDKDAMYELAIWYENGEGTEKNLEKAFYWYQKAAKNGNEEAMRELALCYVHGKGAEENLEKAFYWFQKPAENGNNDAQYFLAHLYNYGEGIIEKNLEKAFYWYQKAAENDNENAMHDLALCYSNGEGTEKNLEKAFGLYQKAIENDNEDAMHDLAICYENGEGTEKNLEKAFYWYQKAAENDNDDAMYNLAICYSNGNGTEKNLEKAFYWYQKAAEYGKTNTMYNLAICYYNGKGTERNLEKTFYWTQKAAENGSENAMRSLAKCYDKGIGTEKNLEKAFYWFQKAAESGNEDVMHDLALCYDEGEGTEKNLEKAFYWYQKAAENGINNAMYNLAVCYRNGEGIEKNLEKAFYWYQKAAESGNKSAMYTLAECYEYGEGTEKKLEKAFGWYQKAAESGNKGAMYVLAECYNNGEGIERNLEKAYHWYQKVKAAESGVANVFNCKGCEKLCIDDEWCQQCNSKRFQQDFLKWTSKNEFIDKFIQEAQLNAKNIYEVLEWIPYNKLKNINYYNKGGFSIIDKAFWLDGPINSWNFDKQQWNRLTSPKGYEVILKNLNNSSNLNDEFLNEWKYYYNCQKKSFSKFVQFFGISQDPNSRNYIIVMSYVKEGSLKESLPDTVKLDWHDKLQLLKRIILGLKIIHDSGLVHCDLHDGNILISNNEVYIIDLGLCKPVSNSQNSENIYGVMPYMAPEVLRGKPYTSASDIYSFSMIMWEFTSGISPFDDRVHDYQLSLSICKGERPKIIENTPKCYANLMEKCWDSELTKRPTLKIIEDTISEWISCLSRYEIVEEVEYQYCPGCTNRGVTHINPESRSIIEEFAKGLAQEQANSTTIQSHPQSYYKSRLLEKVSECLDCEIKNLSSEEHKDIEAVESIHEPNLSGSSGLTDFGIPKEEYEQHLSQPSGLTDLLNNNLLIEEEMGGENNYKRPASNTFTEHKPKRQKEK